MYRPPTALACKIGGVGTCGSLAATGFSVLSYIVAAATLIMLGVVLTHLIPRRQS